MLLTTLLGVPLKLASLPEPDDADIALARHGVGSEPAWGIELVEETAAVTKLRELQVNTAEKLRHAEADCKRTAFNKAALLGDDSAKLAAAEAKHSSASTALVAAEEEANKAREKLKAEVGKSEMAITAAKASTTTDELTMSACIKPGHRASPIMTCCFSEYATSLLSMSSNS